MGSKQNRGSPQHFPKKLTLMVWHHRSCFSHRYQVHCSAPLRIPTAPESLEGEEASGRLVSGVFGAFRNPLMSEGMEKQPSNISVNNKCIARSLGQWTPRHSYDTRSLTRKSLDSLRRPGRTWRPGVNDKYRECPKTLESFTAVCTHSLCVLF